MWGFSIDEVIQKTLGRRAQIYSHNYITGSGGKEINPYTPKSEENISEHELSIERTPYITMISSTSLLAPDGSLPNDSFSTPVEGAEIGDFANIDVVLSNKSNLFYNKFEKKWVSWGDDDAQKFGHLRNNPYNRFGDYTEKDGRKNIPTPGVTGLTSEYHSTSYQNFTRKIQVTWKVYSLTDLNILQERFMNLSRLVYVEWGWKTRFPSQSTIKSTVTNPNTGTPTEEEITLPSNLLHIETHEDGSQRIDISKYKDPTLLRAEILRRGKGNFDACIGVIENFEWNTTENGIECVTNLATMGVNILDSKFLDAQTGLQPTQTGQEAITFYQEDPNDENLMTQYFNEVSNFVLNEKPESTGLTAPYSIGKSSLTKAFDFNYIIKNLHHILEDNYKYLQKHATTDAETDDWDSLTYAHGKYPEGTGPTGAPGQYSLVSGELPEYTFDDDVNKPKVKKEIKVLTTAARIASHGSLEYFETEMEYWMEEKGKSEEEAKSIVEKKALEDKYAGQYIITTSKKFTRELSEEQKKAKKKFYNRMLPGKEQLKYTREWDDDYTKFYFSEIDPNECWVRWGWFEDNILNKYFGLIDNDGNQIAQIRSVIPTHLSHTAFKKQFNHLTGKHSWGTKLGYTEPHFTRMEPVRIRNHKNWETFDIHKFIFPGQFKVMTLNKPQREHVIKESGGIKENAVSIAPELIELADGKYMLDKNLSEQELLRLYEESVTGDISWLNTPSKFSDWDLSSDPQYLYYNELEQMVNTKFNSFYVKDNWEKEGYLRNVLINVGMLQEIFSGTIETLGQVLNRLCDEMNGEKQWFNLKPVAVPIIHDAFWTIQDIRTTESEANGYTNQTHFKFPVNTSESYILSQDLRTDLSSEYSQIVMGDVMAKKGKSITIDEINNTPLPPDKKNGVSFRAHAEFFGYDPKRKVGNNSPFDFYGMGFPPATKEDWERFGNVHAYVNTGNDLTKDGGPNLLPTKKRERIQELELSHRQMSLVGAYFSRFWEIIGSQPQNWLNFGLYRKGYDWPSLNEYIDGRTTSYTEILPGKRATIGFSNYTEDGLLRFPKSLNGVYSTEENGEKVWRFIQDEYALIYLTNTLTLNGIAGIYPANTFTTDYLPSRMNREWSKDNEKLNPHFLIQNVSQEIDTSGWRTTLTGRLHYKWSALYEK